MPTRPLRLPELPGGATGAPEIFAGGAGACGAVRRAVVIGNGCAGAESQCFGLVRALGLADRLTLYRVTRPTGGINKWLHFLPISLHKLVDEVFRHVFSNTRFTTLFQGKRLAQYPVCNGQSFGLSSVLEADAKKTVAMVQDTFKKEGLAIVVACGRDTISYASSIRCLAPDNVFAIQALMASAILQSPAAPSASEPPKRWSRSSPPLLPPCFSPRACDARQGGGGGPNEAPPLPSGARGGGGVA